MFIDRVCGVDDFVWNIFRLNSLAYTIFSCPSSSRPTLDMTVMSLLWIQILGIMRKHDPTNKKTTTKTLTDTFREHLQRAIFDTFDLWDIWSEWWGNMTWPTKRQQQRQWRFQIHLENTPKEGFLKTFWIPLIPPMPHFSTKGKQPSYISSVPAPTPTTLSPAAQGSPPPFSPSSWLSNPTPRCNTYFNPTLGKIMWL